MDSIAAKQFLISKIVEESEFEHVSLSEVERKMLHFTEADQSLPNLREVDEEFERSYDSDEYERKITDLLRRRAPGIKSNPLSTINSGAMRLMPLRKKTITYWLCSIWPSPNAANRCCQPITFAII